MKIRVYYKCFPEALRGAVRGLTSLQGEIYTVLVDAAQSESERLATLKHEVSHIVLGHLLDDQRPIQDLEREADQHAAAMTDEELTRLIEGAACVSKMY